MTSLCRIIHAHVSSVLILQSLGLSQCVNPNCLIRRNLDISINSTNSDSFGSALKQSSQLLSYFHWYLIRVDIISSWIECAHMNGYN